MIPKHLDFLLDVIRAKDKSSYDFIVWLLNAPQAVHERLQVDTRPVTNQLANMFDWKMTPQGHDHWATWDGDIYDLFKSPLGRILYQLHKYHYEVYLALLPIVNRFDEFENATDLKRLRDVVGVDIDDSELRHAQAYLQKVFNNPLLAKIALVDEKAYETLWNMASDPELYFRRIDAGVNPHADKLEELVAFYKVPEIDFKALKQKLADLDKPKFEVGCTYRDKSGACTTIVSSKSGSTEWPFIGIRHTPNGPDRALTFSVRGESAMGASYPSYALTTKRVDYVLS